MGGRPFSFLLALVAATACPSAALASGAAISVTTGQRIDVQHNVIASFSPEGSTVVEQVLWQGDGGETLWVLPVPALAEIVSSSDALVSLFDQSLEVVVRQPPNSCFIAGFNECNGVSVGGSVGGSGGTVLPVAGPVLAPIEEVQVVDDAEVASWFAGLGVTPPAELMEAVQEAELAGYELLLMRLPAGSGLLTSAALRIGTTGPATSVVPMIAPRTGASVGLTVIGDSRFSTVDLPAAAVQEADLEWSWNSSASNYDEVAGLFIEQGWLLEAGEPLSPYVFDRLITLAETSPDASGYDAAIDAPAAARADADALRLGLDPGGTWVTRLDTRVPAAGFPVEVALSKVGSLDIVDRDLTPARETGAIPNCELEPASCGDDFIDEVMPSASDDTGCAASANGDAARSASALVLVALGLARSARRRRLLNA